MKRLAVVLLLMGCVQTSGNLRDNPHAGTAGIEANLNAMDSYNAIQSNVVRCWANGANYLIAGAPGSAAVAPYIQINSTMGHLMAIVDFVELAPSKTRVSVKVGYTLANKSRTENWQLALDDWLSPKPSGFCPKMP